MKVREIMTEKPACCTPDTNLQQVAKMMLDHDCGEIPVVEDLQTRKAIGVITDRDIVCRAVAQGKNASQTTAKECMSKPVATVRPDMSAEECCGLMEEKQIRRVLVVDEKGACCGIVAQADVAKFCPEDDAAHLLKRVSAEPVAYAHL